MFYFVKFSIVKTLRDAGYEVYVWTVLDEANMMTLINAGVSGIFTDYPLKMSEVRKNINKTKTRFLKNQVYSKVPTPTVFQNRGRL